MTRPTIALFALALLTTASAQPVTAVSAVRAVVQSLEDSLNARDWEAFGSLFSEEGDFILMNSRRAIGPADVRSLIAEAWMDTPADVTAKLTPVALRFVTPQVAILTVDGDFTGSQPSKDRAIFVVSNQGSGWFLEAVRVFNPEATPAADAQSNEGSIKSGQFSLAYRIEGTGTPAIVIGFPNYYGRVFSADLRSHLRLIFVDHRGSAPSPGHLPLSEYSLDKISDDIELVRSELGLGPVVIIGHSGQALLALEYAKRYPESVSHVVMIGIAPDLSDESAAEAEQYWERLASSERKAALERNWKDVPEEEPPESFPGESFVNSYVRNGPLAWYDYEFDSTPLWEGVDVNMEMFNHVWGTLLAEIDIAKGLEDLDRPIFLALGKYDFLVAPVSSWNRARPAFKDLTVRVYEKSGHTPQYEQAELFDSELLDWMSAPASD